MSSQKSSASRSRKPLLCLCLKAGRGQAPESSTMSWEPGALLGEYMMRSFGESPSLTTVEIWSKRARPNVVVDSRLSQILEDSVPEKYSLSPTACLGILKRAEKRGKELPPILKEALIQQAGGVLGLDCFDQCLTGTVSKTLTSSATDSDHVPCVLQQIVFENHSQDSRYRYMGDVNETVSAKYGTGGNNQPLVLTIVKERGAY